MADGPEEENSTGRKIAGVALDANGELIGAVAKRTLHDVPPLKRFFLRRIPGGPSYVLDAAEFATAPNKTRAAFGLIGGVAGMAGGDIMAGPVGGVVGSALGEEGGERLYDANKAAIDHFVDPKVDAVRRGLGTMEQWLGLRAAQAATAGRH